MQTSTAQRHPCRPGVATVGTTIMASPDLVVAGLTEILAGPAARRFRLLDATSTQEPDIVLYCVTSAEAGDLHDMRLHTLLRSSRSTVIATYWDDDSPAVAAALRCGAHGAVSMKLSKEKLCDALEDVWGTVTGVRTVSGSGEVCDQGVERCGLSTRELEVLGLVGEGLTNQDIAERMVVSINTVKTYVRAAYRKIGVERRSQAVLWAAQNSVTTPDWLKAPAASAGAH